jgi:hypothetical protein
LFVQLALHSEPAPLLVVRTQQTVFVGQFAWALHFSEVTSPPPAGAGHPASLAATQPYALLAGPATCETQHCCAGSAQDVAPHLIADVLPPGPASGGSIPPSPPRAPLEPPSPPPSFVVPLDPDELVDDVVPLEPDDEDEDEDDVAPPSPWTATSPFVSSEPHAHTARADPAATTKGRT